MAQGLAVRPGLAALAMSLAVAGCAGRAHVRTQRSDSVESGSLAAHVERVVEYMGQYAEVTFVVENRGEKPAIIGPLDVVLCDRGQRCRPPLDTLSMPMSLRAPLAVPGVNILYVMGMWAAWKPSEDPASFEKRWDTRLQREAIVPAHEQASITVFFGKPLRLRRLHHLRIRDPIAGAILEVPVS